MAAHVGIMSWYSSRYPEWFALFGMKSPEKSSCTSDELEQCLHKHIAHGDVYRAFSQEATALAVSAVKGKIVKFSKNGKHTPESVQAALDGQSLYTALADAAISAQRKTTQEKRRYATRNKADGGVYDVRAVAAATGAVATAMGPESAESALGGAVAEEHSDKSARMPDSAAFAAGGGGAAAVPAELSGEVDEGPSMPEVEAVRSEHGFVDLHAHLLGMGDAAFWIDTIMCELLVQEAKKEANEWYETKPSHQNWPSAVAATRDANGDPSFTFEVVYSVENLRSAFRRLDTVTSSENEAFDVLSLLEGADGRKLNESIQRYVIWNARIQDYETVFGIANNVFVSALDAETNKKETPIRNVLTAAFEMNRNADDCLDRKFTPDFYPMRFVLKDSMYAQYPVVLDCLLDVVLTRYWDAGVGYVELSVGLSDALRPWIWKHLAQPKVSPDAKKVKVRYLAAFNRQQCWVKLDTIIDHALNAAIADYSILTADLSKSVLAARAELAEVRRLPESLLEFKSDAIAKAQAKAMVAEVGDPRTPAILHAEKTIDVLGRLCVQWKAIVESEQEGGHDQTRMAAIVTNFLSEHDADSLALFKFEEVNKVRQLFDAMDESREACVADGLHENLVGLDLVGDECAFPFSPFGAGEFIRKILSERSKRPRFNFGLRLHAGEVSLGDDTRMTYDVYARLAAASHAVSRFYTVASSVLPQEQRKTPLLRVGHGVLFCRARPFLSMGPSQFSTAVCHNLAYKAFSLLTQCKIPIEINQTSNKTLLLRAQRALTVLVKSGASVLLCTDNDGIWKCSNGSIHSVAHEYVRAILDNCIGPNDVSRYAKIARYAAFDSVATDEAAT